MTEDPKRLRERRRRIAEAYASNRNVINAVREILGLDPIAENNGKRGKRYATQEEDT